MTTITLFDYWRSSSSYRVRIALWLKGLPFSVKTIDLSRHEQKSKNHRHRNPQGLVPAIEINGKMFTQSLAIIEYVDQFSPNVKLLPDDPVERAHVQALSQNIAMEIHPICNLRVVEHVTKIMGGDSAQVNAIGCNILLLQVVQELEASLHRADTGLFCHGNQPSMADCCLIPQLYNATRWGVDYADHALICKIEKILFSTNSFSKRAPRCLSFYTA